MSAICLPHVYCWDLFPVNNLLVFPPGVEHRKDLSSLSCVRGVHAFLLQLPFVAAVVDVQAHPQVRVLIYVVLRQSGHKQSQRGTREEGFNKQECS